MKTTPHENPRPHLQAIDEIGKAREAARRAETTINQLLTEAFEVREPNGPARLVSHESFWARKQALAHVRRALVDITSAQAALEMRNNPKL